MHKKVTIHLEVDDQGSGQFATTHRHGSDVYTVRVVPEGHSDRLIDVAAHELGHILANVFETKANSEDPRSRMGEAQLFNISEQLGLPIPERIKQRVIASETEAWELGEKMVPDLDPRTKARSLSTYQEGISTFVK